MKPIKNVVNEALAKFGYRLSRVGSQPPNEPPPSWTSRFERWTARGEPSYDDDNIVTWYQSLDFLKDPRHQRAYERYLDADREIGNPMLSGTANITWRTAMSCWLGKHAAHLPGDFVECGVASAGRAAAVCDYLDFNSLGKKFYLFDTFEGIPLSMAAPDERPRAQLENELYYDESFERAKRNMADYPDAVFVRGTIPDTLDEVQIDRVSYLHIDMNIAAPERAAMEHFWPKMVPGGVIYLDDYGWTPYRAQKDTLDEYAASQGVEIMTLPTGQGLLIKP